MSIARERGGPPDCEIARFVFGPAAREAVDGHACRVGTMSAVQPPDRISDAFAALESGGEVVKVLIECHGG